MGIVGSSWSGSVETVSLKEISAAYATSVLITAGCIDPTRQASAETIANIGTAFELTTPNESGVFVIEKRQKQMWIRAAAASKSRNFAPICFEVIAALARQTDCKTVAFQTARLGLAKLAKKQGYRVTGLILEKTL